MLDYSDNHFTGQSFRGSLQSRPPEILHVESTIGMADFSPYKAEAWGLGVILYSLLYGTTPYTTEQLESGQALSEIVYRKRTCQSVKSDAKFVELCRNLLSHQADERMAISEIMGHPALRSASIEREQLQKTMKPNTAYQLR